MRRELTLELADLYMELGQRSKASKLYNQYKIFYPGSPAITYVLYREIVANKYDSLLSSKDQSKTLETLALARQFLEEFPEGTEYTKDVKKIIRLTLLKLLKSEVAAIQFYLSKYVYESKQSVLKAAHDRLEYALKEYAANLKGAENLLNLGQIDTSSPEIYRDGLVYALTQVSDYVDKHAEPEESFITRWLQTKRHGKYPQATRL